MKRFAQVTYAAVLAVAISGTAATATAESYDLVILGGRVIDPETGLDGPRNVGLNGGTIAAVTSDDITAPRVIDAEGLVVSPGFIDMHAHGQRIPAARMQALDGVTTGLELESGVLPVADYYEKREQQGRPINYGASVNWAAARIAAMLDIEPSSEPDWFFSKFSIRHWQEELASPEELESILSLIQQGIDEGGLGVGILLGYAPDSGRKEYYAVSRLAANAGLPTYTHARYLSMIEPESSFEGMAEIVNAAAATGVHAHVVHMNSISLRDSGLIGQMFAGAQKQGLRITTEAYPYGAGSTGIGAAMFRGPDWRERTGGMTAHSFDVGGKRLTEKEFADLQRDKPGTETIMHFLELSNPEDQAFLDTSVLFPGGVIASDGGTWLMDGEAISQDTWPVPDNAWSHPRSAGTYGRFLRHYVRDSGQVTLLEAIGRISYRPAKILQDAVPQMKKKGRLQVGADADIVIFDPETVSDRATYEKPAQASVGFRHVIVNGVPLVTDGVLDTSVLPGKAIRNAVK